jgi:DNA invertase Pin-like site-specific DNA recombinase
MRLGRAERFTIMALAQARRIDAVLVTELSRWESRPTDLLATLKELELRRVSVVALNGTTFDLTTPHGRMMATMLAGIAEFERESTQERIRSGIAAAKARGKRLGRQSGQRPKIRPARAAGAGTRRKATQSYRARGWAKQKHRRRHHQTPPR